MNDGGANQLILQCHGVTLRSIHPVVKHNSATIAKPPILRHKHPMSKSLKRVKRTATELGLEIEVVETSMDTHTAEQAAQSQDCHVDQIGKSIIFRGETSGSAILFLTAGGNRVDATKASAVAGEPLGKADAALIRAQTGFAIGGVSPIGHLTPPRAFLDAHLMNFDLIWAAAGTPHHMFSIPPRTLVAATDAEIARFAAEPPP